MLKNKILKYTKDEYISIESNILTSVLANSVLGTLILVILFIVPCCIFLTFQNKNKEVKGVSYFWQEKYFLLHESMT